MKIAYKILTPIISLCTLAVLFFLPILRLFVSSGLASAETKTNLLSSFGIKEFTSFYDMIGMSKSASFETIKSVVSSLMEKQGGSLDLSNVKFLYVSLVFLGVLVLLVLAVAVLSIVMKKCLLPTLLACGAVISALIMNASFNAFAKPFISGEINIGSFLNSDNAALGTILGSLARVERLELGSAYLVALFLLAAVVVLGVCMIFEEKYAGNK